MKQLGIYLGGTCLIKAKPVQPRRLSKEIQVSDWGLTYAVPITTANIHSTVVASVVFCPYKRADFVVPTVATTTVRIIRYPVKGGQTPTSRCLVSIS